VSFTAIKGRFATNKNTPCFARGIFINVPVVGVVLAVLVVQEHPAVVAEAPVVNVLVGRRKPSSLQLGRKLKSNSS